MSEPHAAPPAEPETTPAASQYDVREEELAPADEVLDEDLLVEEVSIDGMCGVY